MSRKKSDSGVKGKRAAGGPRKSAPAAGSSVGNVAGNKVGQKVGSGKRSLATRVKTAKGRRISSTRWLKRQLNDPYVVSAREQGLRSRAAFKLMQIQEKFEILSPGNCVVDLGAAPGGWSVLASDWVRSVEGKGHVVALDLVEIEPVAGVTFLRMDFMDDDAPDRLIAALDGRRANAVISDMAAPSTGHKQTDHLRIIGLCEAALEFAREVLAPDGVFLAKVLQGGATNDLLNALKRDFSKVRHIKPDASRADSSELFVLATGFRGTPSND
ncbi:MAG: RlmE family RNA methyltransferase [Pseudomonadota bacterium]